MNIQEAVKESLKTKKMFTRKDIDTYLNFVPIDDPKYLIMLVDLKNRRLPGRGWQPSVEDLLSNDWYITDIDYQNLITAM